MNRDLLGVIVASFALSACAREVKTCSQASTSGRLTSTEIVGGIVEADADPRIGDSTPPKMYCTAAIGTVDGSPILYGARHCFRVGSYRNFRFHRFMAGEYRPEQIPLPQEILAEQIKSDSTITNPELRARLREILDGGPPMAISGDAVIKRCVEKIPGGTSACFTGLEFTAIRLNNAMARPSRMISSRQAVALEALDTLWRARAVSAFQAELKRCKDGSVQCEPTFLKEGEAAFQRYFSRSDWTRIKTRSQSAAFNGIASVWSDLDEKRAQLSVAGNFSGSNAFGTVALTAAEVTPNTPPGPTQTMTRWQDNRPYSRTFLLRALSEADAPIKFTSGDSGAMLLADGLPVAILSHVDGHETSGGASVIPLPRRVPSAASNETQRGADGGAGSAPPSRQPGSNAAPRANEGKPPSESSEKVEPEC